MRYNAIWARVGNFVQFLTVFRLELIVLGYEVYLKRFFGISTNPGSNSTKFEVAYAVFPWMKYGSYVKAAVWILERYFIWTSWEDFTYYIDYQKWFVNRTAEERQAWDDLYGERAKDDIAEEVVAIETGGEVVDPFTF